MKNVEERKKELAELLGVTIKGLEGILFRALKSGGRISVDTISGLVYFCHSAVRGRESYIKVIDAFELSLKNMVYHRHERKEEADVYKEEDRKRFYNGLKEYNINYLAINAA